MTRPIRPAPKPSQRADGLRNPSPRAKIAEAVFREEVTKHRARRAEKSPPSVALAPLGSIPTAAPALSDLLSDVGLTQPLPADLDYERFARLWQALERVGSGANWAQGDLLVWLKHQGDEKFYQAVNCTPERSRLLTRMAERFPRERRRSGSGIDWSHFVAVSHLPAAQQESWLDKTAGLSVHELRLRLKTGEERMTSSVCPTCGAKRRVQKGSA